MSSRTFRLHGMRPAVIRTFLVGAAFGSLLALFSATLFSSSSREQEAVPFSLLSLESHGSQGLGFKASDAAVGALARAGTGVWMTRGFQRSCDVCGMKPDELAAALSDGTKTSRMYLFHGRWLHFDELYERQQLLFEVNGKQPVCIVIFLHRGSFPCDDSTAGGCLLPLWIRPGASDVRLLPHVLQEKEFQFLQPTFNISFIVDAGANIGLATLIFHMVYPSATIIALEPSPDNFEILSMNTKDIAKVVSLRAALYSHLAGLEVVSGAKDAAEWAYEVKEASGIRFKRRPADVAGVSIPFLLSTYHFSAVDYLKIDIEGSERVVFSSSSRKPFGGLDWVFDLSVMSVEVHDDGVYETSDVIKRLFRRDKFFQRRSGECLVFLRFDLGDPSLLMDGGDEDDFWN